MTLITDLTTDEERALYGSKDLELKNCAFDGPADGESAIKECSNIKAENIFFNLRYPCWHVHGITINNSEMTDKCRAALWYSDHIDIKNTKMHGIKALRECSDVTIRNSDIISPEFGWSVNGLHIESSHAESEYFMMRSSDLTFENVSFKGKYSFQYVKNAEIKNCRFDTKDAFWHSENITVRDSIINGEYLAWYSKNLKLINCTITGTQPFCYCDGLVLENCIMNETDLCFERSDVNATVHSDVISIKNPLSGTITVKNVGEIIRDIPEAKGEIIISDKK